MVETLAVIAIISVLASLLLPCLKAARNEATAVSSRNKMRQCATSILLYQTDQDNTRALPLREELMIKVGHTLSCTPADSWRKSCDEDWGIPLVGSFAYLGGISPFDKGVLRNTANAPLLVHIFHSQRLPDAFKGLSMADWAAQASTPPKAVQSPETVEIVHEDLSLRRVKTSSFYPSGLWMNWAMFFLYYSIRRN